MPFKLEPYECDNTVFALMVYFGLDYLNEKDWSEFITFWLSLTHSERRYYRTVPLR